MIRTSKVSSATTSGWRLPAARTLGITVIVTEGFGDIAMAERTFDMLKDHAGDDASVNGATQIRAGVMRPEIIIPLAQVPSQSKDWDADSGELAHWSNPAGHSRPLVRHDR